MVGLALDFDGRLMYFNGGPSKMDFDGGTQVFDSHVTWVR